MSARWYTLENWGPPEHKTWSGFRGRWIDSVLIPRLPKDAESPRPGVGPVSDWPWPSFVQVDRSKPVQDQVLASNVLHTVSTRVKEVLERAAGDDLQFLPVLLHHVGTLLDVPPYWLVNPLRLVDCLHCSASGVTETLENEGYESKTPFLVTRKAAVFVSDLIPSDAHAFVVRFGRRSDLVVSAVVREAVSSLDPPPVGVFWEGRTTRRASDDLVRSKVGEPLRPLQGAGVRFAAPPLEGEIARKVQQDLEEVRSQLERAKAFLQPLIGKSEAEGAELGSPAPEEYIRRIEERLGHRVPCVYAEFLRACGSLDLGAQTIEGYAIGKGGALQSTEQYLDLPEWHWPRHMLVIAGDGMGGDFCLDLSKANDEDAPVVYHDHELDDFDHGSKRITPNFQACSPSFAKWVRKIARTGRML